MLVSIRVEGKKFMWDGVEYATKEDAMKAVEAYKNEGFEVHTLEEGEKILVFTRRVVKEIQLSGPPPLT